MRRSLVHKAVIFGAIAVVIGACSGPSDPRLLNLKSEGPGPDEFSILPNKPLSAPDSYSALPAPTPGQINLADPTPEQNAIAALGGNPARAIGGGVRDNALIAHTGRYGAEPGIRQRLAEQDLEFRRRNDGRLLERVFNVNVYYRAYRRQALDKYRELERFRRAGVPTPAVPPSLSE